jgi:catechol 2,3-dioxygenase-like lactoylglutathione lyase family enzyme
MITGVHHVGQIVEDFDAALTLTEDVLGATVFERRDLASENTESRDDAGSGAGTDPAVWMAFTEVPDCQLHLISREERDTDIDPLLDSLLAASPHYVAYTVPDIREAIARVEEAGFEMYDTEPVSGLGPYERAFAVPKPCRESPSSSSS